MQEKFFESVRDVQTNEYLGQIAEARNAAEPYFRAISSLITKYDKLAKPNIGPVPKLISMYLVSVSGLRETTGVPIGQEINFVLFEMSTNPIKDFLKRPNSLFVVPAGDNKANLTGRTFFGHDDSGTRQLDIPMINEDEEVIEDSLSIQLKRKEQDDLFAVYEGNRIEGEGKFVVKSYPLYDRRIYQPYTKSRSDEIGKAHVVDAEVMTGYLLGKLDEPDFKEHLGIARKIALGKPLNVELMWK